MEPRHITAIIMGVVGLVFCVLSLLRLEPADLYTIGSVWFVGAIILAWMPSRKKEG